MPDPLKKVLSRWELDPPTFSASERSSDDSGLLDWLECGGILCPTHSSGAWTCTECGSVSRLIFLTNRNGASHTYAMCRRCGPAEIAEGELNRYVIEGSRLLEAIFQPHRYSPRLALPPSFWNIGRGNWAGRSREACFVIGTKRDSVALVQQALAGRPKVVLFVPSCESRLRWQLRIPNPVIALEDALRWSPDGLVLDDELVSLSILDATSAVAPAVKPAPKRSARAAKIEALRRELKGHLCRACDHARDSQDRNGEAQLLPRPTQEELAKRLGFTKSDVSRCLRDPSAKELKMLWDSAADVYEVMKLGKLVR